MINSNLNNIIKKCLHIIQKTTKPIKYINKKINLIKISFNNLIKILIL